MIFYSVICYRRDHFTCQGRTLICGKRNSVWDLMTFSWVFIWVHIFSCHNFTVNAVSCRNTTVEMNKPSHFTFNSKFTFMIILKNMHRSPFSAPRPPSFGQKREIVSISWFQSQFLYCISRRATVKDYQLSWSTPSHGPTRCCSNSAAVAGIHFELKGMSNQISTHWK